MDCWICGSEAGTGEHIIKRSDLASLFPNVTQADPLFVQKQSLRNHQVGSLRSSKLTHSAKLCASCNNSLTQPHDRAWERLSNAMHARNPRLQSGSVFRAQLAFPNHTHFNLLLVHLFFVKSFGCMIKSGGVNIPLAPFADAISRGRAHPQVYLKFGCGVDENVAAVSDLWVDTLDSGEVVYATWFYQVGRIWVNLMFANEEQDREGIIGAWHPRYGTARFSLSNFQA